MDALMPFHSMTTTDSAESISGGLAKSPSEVLNPPSSSPKLQVAACSRADASHGLFLRTLSAWQDAREHITQFLEYETACRAPIRTCTELYGSATSAWVKVLPQSELMGPSSAGFALAPGNLPHTHLLDNVYAPGWYRFWRGDSRP